MISDTSIWIPHMSAITCRPSLLQLFAQFHPLQHLYTSCICITCLNYTTRIHKDLQGSTRSVVLKLSNLHICCKWPQVLEEGLQREMHLFRPCVINVWIPVFFNTCDLLQCPNSALCESTSMSKLQLAECTFTPFFGIATDIIVCCACVFPFFPCAWEAPAWVKKLLQMSVNILYLYNCTTSKKC